MAKGRGLSSNTTMEYRKVRNLYKKRMEELGDMAIYVSKEYYIEYLTKNSIYKRDAIKKILNMPPDKIRFREAKAKEDLFEAERSKQTVNN